MVRPLRECERARDNAGMTHSDLPLGRAVPYPRLYDPGLLFPIARSLGRSALGLGATPPFIGLDRWHAYELSWLDARGKPVAATATIGVPADSPNLIESKSLKLYLNSFNATRFDLAEEAQGRIVADLSRAAAAPVAFSFGLPDIAAPQQARSLDELPVQIDDYGPPNSGHLRADAGERVEEVLHSALFKSNCPVTGQPDWGSVRIGYRGPRIDHAGLLKYLVSFREHAEFHEQCVERIFVDLLAQCRPESLSVEARYTRRGGLDINPWRATGDWAPPTPARDLRQ